MMARRKTGFTLIELVIVIVILGILAAVAIPKYVNLSSSAADATAQDITSSVKSGFALYLAENNGTFPPNCSALINTVQPQDTELNCDPVGGISFIISGRSYIIFLWNTTTCDGEYNLENPIRCVGSLVIPPWG